MLHLVRAVCATRWLKRALVAASLGAVVNLGLPALAADNLHVGTATTSVIVAPLLLMDVQSDLMTRRDITMKITDFQGKSANCITALIAKSTDVCIVGTTTGTDAIAEGADLKVIGSFSIPINEVVLSAKTVQKLGVAPTAPVADRLKAMKGLRIISAAPGSAHYITLDRMLQGAGLTIKDLKYQVLGDTVAMVQAIKNDQVDGAMWSAGSLGGMIADGSGVRWISVPKGDVPALSALPYTGIFVRSDWLEKNQDLVKRFQAALTEAVEIVRAGADETSKKIKAKYFPSLDNVIWEDGLAQARAGFFTGGKIPKAGWDGFLDLQAKSSSKNYAPAAFDKVVTQSARVD